MEQAQQQQRKRPSEEDSTVRATKKSKSSSDEAPAPRVPASSQLLQSKNYRTLVAEGLVTTLSETHRTIVLRHHTTLDGEDLHLHFKGDWSKGLFAEGAAEQGKGVVISFKESTVLREPSRPPTLLFDRGCHIWLQASGTAAEGHKVAGGKIVWKEHKLFKLARNLAIVVQTEEKGQTEAIIKEEVTAKPEAKKPNAPNQGGPSCNELPAKSAAAQAEAGKGQVETSLPFADYIALEVRDQTRPLRYLSCTAWQSEPPRDLAHVIAIAVDANCLTPKATGKAHTTFELFDAVTPRKSGLKVTFMRNNPDEIPLLDPGDIVLLRNAKHQKFGSSMKLVIFYDKPVELAVWKRPDLANGIPKAEQMWTLSSVMRITRAELAYMYRLASWYDQHHQYPPANISSPIARSESFKRELRSASAGTSGSTSRTLPPTRISATTCSEKRLEQLELPTGTSGLSSAFSCVVEILEGFPTADMMEEFKHENRFPVRVTDYTENRYFEPAYGYGYLPHRNQYVFEITVWVQDMPSIDIRMLNDNLSRPGALVLLRGCQVKKHKHKDILEGKIASRSEMLDVRVLPESDERVQQLLQRRAVLSGETIPVRVGQTRYNRRDSGYQSSESHSPTQHLSRDKGDRAPSAMVKRRSASSSDHEAQSPVSHALPPGNQMANPAYAETSRKPSMIVDTPTVPQVQSHAPMFRATSIVAGAKRPPRKLEELSLPDGRNDYFDIVCEVALNAYYDPSETKQLLYVVDWTFNEYLPDNVACPEVPPGKLVLMITFFDNGKYHKVKNLKVGDRVYLKNIRVRKDNYNQIEGHVGERGTFDIRRLPATDPKWAELEEAKKLFAEQTGDVVQEDQPAHEHHCRQEPAHLEPQPLDADMIAILEEQERQKEAAAYAERHQQVRGSEHVICKRGDADLDVIIGDGRTEGYWKLRGRIVKHEPKMIEDWIVTRCQHCRQRLTVEHPDCNCDREVLASERSFAWQAILDIELEPMCCNIKHDEVNEKYVIKVALHEPRGKTVFMNGIEPENKPGALIPARTLVQGLTGCPAGKNPVFDFVIYKKRPNDPCFLVETALKRKDERLPW